MAAKKATTKKDLESKIAELEAKLTKLSSQLQTPPTPKPAQTSPPPKPAETKPSQTQAPPKPQPAATSPKGSLPKGMEQKPAEAPKPAEKAGTPANVAQALEHSYQNARMTNTHDYKTKTPGFTPAPNRYFVRKTAPLGTVPTQNWNIQKSKVTGYTQPSNQYFATRARLAYHPPEKTFTGYGMKVEGVPEAKAQTQTAPPPPPPKPSASRGSLPKGMGQPQAQVQQTQQRTSSSGGSEKSRQEQLADYEAEYLARMDRERQEAEELQRAAEELAAKRRSEGQSSSSPGKSRGTLPKGF